MVPKRRAASLCESVCTHACIVLLSREMNAAGTEIKFKSNRTNSV